MALKLATAAAGAATSNAAGRRAQAAVAMLAAAINPLITVPLATRCARPRSVMCNMVLLLTTALVAAGCRLMRALHHVRAPRTYARHRRGGIQLRIHCGVGS